MSVGVPSLLPISRGDSYIDPLPYDSVIFSLRILSYSCGLTWYMLFSPHEYERILNDKITESYKLDHSDTITQINRDTTKFAHKVDMIE